MSASPVPPLLVFGWGNPSRGDDALGPQCIAQLRQHFAHEARIEFLEDFQLQVEHALDLLGRTQVLLVDASASGTAPFATSAVHAAQDASYTSHALSPQALLQAYAQVSTRPLPACTLLAIRGTDFALGASLSTSAHSHLQAATRWARQWLEHQLSALPTPACSL